MWTLIMRTLKSFTLLTIAFVVTMIVASELPIYPTYLGAVVIVVALLFSHKFCSHRYCVVLPLTFIFFLVIPSYVLIQISLSANPEQTVTMALAQIWSLISISQKFTLFLPIAAAFVTLMYINQPHNK